MNTADGEGPTLIGMPVQLAEKHPYITEQTKDNIGNKKLKSAAITYPKVKDRQRLYHMKMFPTLRPMTKTNWKIIKKYNTNTDSYEMPSCRSHMSPKAEQLGKNLQSENTPQVVANAEKELIDSTVYEGYEIPEQFGQKQAKIERATNSTAYENLDKGTVRDQEAIKDNETEFKLKRIQKSANGSNSCTGPEKRRLSHQKQVAEENQNSSKEGVYEVPTPGAKDDEMEKHIYSVLLQ